MAHELTAALKAALPANAVKALAEQLDLHTIGDLVYHFPRRYEERAQATEIASLDVGDHVTLVARILTATKRRMKARNDEMLDVVVGDDSGGRLALTYFGRRQMWHERYLQPGRVALFAGKVTMFNGKRQLNSPQYVLLDGDESTAEEVELISGLIPVYPATAKLPTWQIAKAVRIVLDTMAPPPDPMPDRIVDSERLLDLGTALREIHRPSSRASLERARKRLKWDEAFAVQVSLVQRKLRAASWPATPRPRRDDGILAAFDAGLPYQLTEGQLAVGEEIAAELATPHPMHRLLQGEVGSGKTLCALRAMLQVVDAGGQAALLAPTEVLASQHYRNMCDLLGAYGRAGELDLQSVLQGSARVAEPSPGEASAEQATRVALVTGSLGASARRAAQAAAASGEAGIVVGTHALLYESVEFADLGLVVVDEQHRFGVEQRDALRAKGSQPPHVLVMTATPIPRTVAMTVFGDLEVSTLSQLPKGRSPIASHVVPAAEKPAFLDRAWQRLREEVEKGHQAYVVCPRIGEESAPGEDSTVDEAGDDEDRRAPLAVLEIAPLLMQGPLAGLRLNILHGRLPADEKEAVMRAFARGELDVLVATTVVEVGVDVPNATVMIVLDADRFGVSQLHQLRGRVGRGSAPGLCLLVTDAHDGTPARERLAAVASTVDGFRLAELDLEQRREGDVLGQAQSGRRSSLRLLSLLKDAELIRDARQAAIELLDHDPELTGYPRLAETVAALVDEDRAEYLEKG